MVYDFSTDLIHGMGRGIAPGPTHIT